MAQEGWLRGSRVGVAALSLTGVAACGGATVAPGVSSAPAEIGCEASPGAALRPVGEHRTGSTIALAIWSGRAVAVVADEDDRALHVLDLDASRPLARHALGGVPSQLLVTQDGRIVVALGDRSEVAVVHATGSKELVLSPGCTRQVPAEPVGLAATPDDRQLLVTSAWGARLSVLRATDLERVVSVALPRDPFAVTVSDDGKTAFVGHVVGGRMSAVDLRSREVTDLALGGRPSALLAQRQRVLLEQSARGLLPSSVDVEAALAEHQNALNESGASHRMGCQGFALAKSRDPSGRLFAPQVLVEPGDPTRRPTGYGDEHVTTELPSVAVVDVRARSVLGASVDSQGASLASAPASPNAAPSACLLPRAAAVDADRGTLLVTCLGIDAVVAYDARAASPVLARVRQWRVPAGPSGIAVDPQRDRAVVWSQFEQKVTLLPLGVEPAIDDDRTERHTSIRVTPAPENELPIALALGRILFHASGDVRVSSDGRACASCHPMGRDDGITWATPSGPRRTKMLAGMLEDTAPFSWSGDTRDLETHVTQTFDRLRGTGGLRSLELEALLAYVRSLPPPPRVDGAAASLVARGEEIFGSARAGCTTCHTGTTLTDARTHDVNSDTRADRAREFDTPSLRHLAGRAPYFHDGRYGTLDALVEKVDGSMGHTAHLSASDRAALVAFLRSL